MKYNENNQRIAKMYSKMSKMSESQRDEFLQKLSAETVHQLFLYHVKLLSGEITVPADVDEEEISQQDGAMSYQTFKTKTGVCDGTAMREVSQFAMEFPATYAKYEEKYQKEREEELRLHNWKILQRY